MKNINRNLKISTSGFTLIELIVVVVIIAISAMIAVPMVSSAGSFQVRCAADMIAADMEYARSLAISLGQNVIVAFDPVAESYQLQDKDGVCIAHPVKKGFNYEITFANDSRLEKVDIVSVDFNSATSIKFDYLGSPCDAAGGALNNGVVTLQGDQLEINVRIAAVTGYVTIE